MTLTPRSAATYLGVTVLLITASPLFAQPEPQSNSAGPVNIDQQKPSFLVRAEVNHETRSYREGDALSVKVVSEADAFVYVFYQQADNKVFQIFPNNSQRDNRLKARQAVSIPGSDDLFRWKVSAPFGKERITVLASKEPIENLNAESLREKRFNPVSTEQLKGVEFELGREATPPWARADVELTTSPRNAELVTGTAKRVGVFFGVSQYMFNAEKEAVSEGKAKMNLATCHRDARRLADVLREVGVMNDQRVFTNEQATRQNLQQSITQWLPSVTKPGDTVFIYFSGHGMKIKDDNGDERDGEDEVLLPHDFVGLDVLVELVKKAKENKLEPGVVPTVLKAVNLVKQAGGSLEKASQLLSRETGVSDDLFGHWLQSLDGRQVVVILDICFAGGFATQEKDLFAKPPAPAFDFLDSEIGRLKDIGQRETALLAASSTLTTSSVRLENDLSVMTFYLLEGILSARGPLTLPEATEYCRPAMKKYFEERPRLTPHEPQLFNYCTKPVWLKP